MKVEEPADGGWLVVTSHREQALAFCRSNLFGEPTVLTLTEVLRNGRRFRRFLSDRNIRKIAVYSESLDNQATPQILELLLAASGASDRILIDGRSGKIQRVGRFDWVGTVARAPLDVAQAGILAFRESMRMLKVGRRRVGVQDPTERVLGRKFRFDERGGGTELLRSVGTRDLACTDGPPGRGCSDSREWNPWRIPFGWLQSGSCDDGGDR